MDLSICIVNWNTKVLLQDCLTSIYQHIKNLSFEIFVVDNNSSDDSVAMVRAQFPRVKLIQNTDNVGYAQGNNHAIKLSKGNYILLLNTDTLLLDAAIEEMKKFMDENKDVAICGCRHIHSDGSAHASHGRFLTLGQMFIRLFYPKSLREKILFCPQDLTTPHPIETDSISGAGLMVRREAFNQVGMMDDQFFFYYEETDWCYRMKKSGWRVCWLPWLQMIHYGGASANKEPSRFDAELYKSEYRFFRKHYGVLSAMILKIFNSIHLLIKIGKSIFAVLYRINNKPKLEYHMRVLKNNWRSLMA